MQSFDPGCLQGLALASDDGVEVSAVDESELLQVIGPDVRRRCAALRLGALMVGRASVLVDTTTDDDTAFVTALTTTMERIAELRDVALQHVGADRSAPDFAHVWNAVTTAVVNTVASEWQWTQVCPSAPPLRAARYSALLAATTRLTAQRAESSAPQGDAAQARRLAVLEAAGMVHGLPNYFDYFQTDRDAFVQCLLRAVVEQAEAALARVAGPHTAAWATRGFVERLYRTSTQLLRECFKACATCDVAALRALPELDRSLRTVQLERVGMPFEHVLAAHALAMAKALDAMDAILDSGARKLAQVRAA